MHAYVTGIILVLIIFPVILQTVINVIMLSIGRLGGVFLVRIFAKNIYKLNCRKNKNAAACVYCN